MKILGFYTHLHHLHVYYADAERVFEQSIYAFEERSLSQEIPALFEQYLKKATPECIAIHNGPGAFTSLRVTLSFVQGLSTGFNIPLYVCDHFQLLQDAYTIQDGLLVIENKSQMLPAVHVKEGLISEPFQLARSNLTNSIALPQTFPLENCSKNLAFTLYERARLAPDSWIPHTALSPNYCFLPNYQKTQSVTPKP